MAQFAMHFPGTLATLHRHGQFGKKFPFKQRASTSACMSDGTAENE